MRKTLFLVLLFMSVASLLPAAESSVQVRRIEEEKRASLRPTEQVVFEAKEPAAKPPDIDIAYFQELISRKVTYLSDACRVLTLLMKADIGPEEVGSQIAFLKEKKVFPRAILKGLDPDLPLRKGVLAYMFCKALDIKGGIVPRVFGLNQRYAIKELNYEGMLYPGDAEDVVSGRELVLLFTGSSRGENTR